MGLGRYYTRLGREAGYSLAKGIALPFVRRDAVVTGSHAMIHPVNTYSPWLGDEAFQSVYTRVCDHTLVDITSCYELWQLVEQVAEVPGAILEVGVWRGGTGALMASRAAELGITDPIYLCDTWTGVVKTGAADPYYHDGKHDDTSIGIVRALVDRLRLDNVQLLQGIFPDDTATAVTQDALRLAHIDVDVYESAKDVFDWAWPRLSPGGVVVFDDYGCAATPGVTKLVNELRNESDRFFVHNINGHGILFKHPSGER
jgi:O-methyltransferase